MAQIWCRTRCTNNKTWNGKNATSSQWIINFKDGFPSIGFQGKSWQLRNGFKASPSPTSPSRSTSSTSGDVHWGWCWGWGEEKVMAWMFTGFGLNLHGKFHMVYASGIYSGIYAKSGNRVEKEKKKIQKVNILGVFLSLMFDHFFFFCIFKWKFVPLCTSSSFVFCTTSEILTSASFKMFLRNTNLCDDKHLGERINFLTLFCGGRGA